MKLLSTVLYGAVASIVGVLGAGDLTSRKHSAFLAQDQYKVVVVGSHTLLLHTMNPVLVRHRMSEQEAYDAFSDIGCKARIVRVSQSEHLEEGEKVLVWCELPDYSSPEYSEWHPWVLCHVMNKFPYLKERVRLVRCDAIIPAHSLVRSQHKEYRSGKSAVSIRPFQDFCSITDSASGVFCPTTWHVFVRKNEHWIVEVHEIFHAWQSWMIAPNALISDWHKTDAGRSFIEAGKWRLSKKGEWSNKKGVWLYGSPTPPPPLEEMASVATVHFAGPEMFSKTHRIPLSTVLAVYEQYQPWLKEYLPRPPLLAPPLE